MLVRYEELIENPRELQQQIADRLQIKISRDFSDFHTRSDKKHKDIKSLGGVRPIDPKNVGKYLQEQNRKRIKGQLKHFPEISDYLIKYGYEKDREWEKRVLSDL